MREVENKIIYVKPWFVKLFYCHLVLQSRSYAVVTRKAALLQATI